ncbi:HAD-IA family hydrolase [Marinobacteraceae bacterium S3BR75-40.1]
MTYKGFIFDWDGTLVDSVDHIATSLQKAAREVGFPERSFEELKDIIGLGMEDALTRLYPGITPDAMLALRQSYAGYFFSVETTQNTLFEGVESMLARLFEHSPLAVATGKSRRGLDWALQTTGLKERFQITRCADETRSKPDPLMLHQVLEAWRMSPAETVMVGDTVYDMEMAQRAGMPAIGVTWGVHKVDALAAYDPVAIVESVGELQDLLHG